MDESERLKMSGIEQLREIYDAGNIGLIFIGMPGLEKKLSRYPQTIFNDLLDHVKDDQSNLILALEYARAGDILVVWDTSTLCLDSQNFIDIIQTLQQRDISLQILAGNFLEIKPRSWESRVMLESYSVLANLERKYLC